MASDHLTPKQEKFAQRLVETDKPSESYRFAYDAENMSDEAVAVEACRLQDNPNVALRIEELRRLHLKRHEVTVDRVIAEYAKLAFLDIRKAFDDEGRLKGVHDLDDDTAAAICGIEAEELYEGRGESREHVGRLHKIKLSDKKAALDSLSRYLGMFTDKTELSGPNGTPLAPPVVAVTPEAVKAIVQQVRDEF
jgi:phage terminase small subunit